jgi:MarR family transcriptional regulator, lower aerobic nicotinate degradation pathway regulator
MWVTDLPASSVALQLPESLFAFHRLDDRERRMSPNTKLRKMIWSRPGFLVRRLHQIHVAIFLKECAKEQVTPIQWGILTIVQAQPGVGHAEIADELGLDRSNVANVLDRLARRQLLKQTASRTDKRRKSVSITPKGRAVLAAFKPNAQRAQRKLLELLSEEERRVFMKMLTRLVEHNNGLSRAPIRLED